MSARRRHGPLAQPLAGRTFQQACATPVHGTQRRRLVITLAALADAGEHSPPMGQLAGCLGLPPTVVDQLLDELIADGWLTVVWAGSSGAPPGGRGAADGRRNRYELQLEFEPDGAAAALMQERSQAQ